MWLAILTTVAHVRHACRQVLARDEWHGQSSRRILTRHQWRGAAGGRRHGRRSGGPGAGTGREAELHGTPSRALSELAGSRARGQRGATAIERPKQGRRAPAIRATSVRHPCDSDQQIGSIDAFDGQAWSGAQGVQDGRNCRSGGRPPAAPRVVRARDRTADLPIPSERRGKQPCDHKIEETAGQQANDGRLPVARGGVEPPTFRFSVGRSYQLSYLAEGDRRRRSPSGQNHTGAFGHPRKRSPR